MTPEEYRALRESVGSQSEVAFVLEVSVSTLSRRENGRLPITQEAGRAMLHLARAKGSGEGSGEKRMH